MIYIIGTGPMAQAHAKVLVHLKKEFTVIGRGNTSAGTFYSEVGVQPITGGIDLYLSTYHFNATDLMEKLIQEGKKVVAYPLVGYWLDIGKHEDYEKAQQDIKQIKF